jgi:methyltransferase (TIGR00027 family)
VVTATAHWIAAVRARETARADHLFVDRFAAALAGTAGVSMMERSERAAGSENSYIPVRVRWFDDAIQAATSQVAQVVLLGAGLDTRPLRLDLPPDLTWYDLDRSEVLAEKHEVLRHQATRCEVRPVAADLAADWGTPLRAAGFAQHLPTAWIAEGLLFYLEDPISLLREIATMSAAGSTFIADIMGAAGLEAPSMHAYRDHCARNGLPPPFGSDDPAGLLAEAGWRPRTLVVPGGPDANFARLPAAPAGGHPGAPHFVIAGLSSAGWSGPR